MSNLTKEELFNMIEALRERLDLLEGRPRGPISMTEARLAYERGDKAIVERFHMQESERLKNQRGEDRYLGRSHKPSSAGLTPTPATRSGHAPG